MAGADRKNVRERESGSGFIYKRPATHSNPQQSSALCCNIAAQCCSTHYYPVLSLGPGASQPLWCLVPLLYTQHHRSLFSLQAAPIHKYTNIIHRECTLSRSCSRSRSRFFCFCLGKHRCWALATASSGLKARRPPLQRSADLATGW